MVASFIDGRIRVRDEAFISRSRVFDVEDALLKNNGITRTSITPLRNATCGSWRAAP